MFLKLRNGTTQKSSNYENNNWFKQTAARLLITAGLTFGCGTDRIPNEPDGGRFEPSISIRAEDESVPEGKKIHFEVAVKNMRPEESTKIAMFLIDADRSAVQEATAVPIISDKNGSTDVAIEMTPGRTGIYLAAAKLTEPDESEWGYARVGVRPDIEPAPEGLLTFEVTDWSKVNIELNPIVTDEVVLPFSFGSVALAVEPATAVADADGVFFYSARGIDEPEIRGGITVDGTTSSGFVMYPRDAPSPFNGGVIQWFPHNETGATIVYRDIDEQISTDAIQFHEEDTTAARCLPDDGTYRFNVYYDSTMNLYEAVRIVEEAKIYLEPLERTVEWSGPWAREGLTSPRADQQPAFDEFLQRSDMGFPGCRDGDFKIFISDSMENAGSSSGMAILGIRSAQRRGPTLAHEIGHLFGARHDCNPIEGQICYAIYGRPLFELGCDDFDDLVLRTACQSLVATIGSTAWSNRPVFSIMLNYLQDRSYGCVEGCWCSDDLCQNNQMEQDLFSVLNLVGCISPTFSDLSLCEINNSWEACIGINEEGCHAEETCDMANHECFISNNCSTIVADAEGMGEFYIDGEILVYSVVNDDGSFSSYYANISTGETNQIVGAGGCEAYDRPRISNGRIVLSCYPISSCNDSDMCMYRIGESGIQPIDYGSGWEIYENRVVYQAGLESLTIYDISTAEYNEIEFPTEYRDGLFTAFDLHFNEPRIAMILENSITSEDTLCIYDIDSGSWQIHEEYLQNGGSPDFTLYGDRIAYRTSSSTTQSGDVFIYDIVSRVVERLPLDDFQPHGGPSGRMIGLWEDRLVFEDYENTYIYLMNLTTGNVIDVAGDFPAGRHRHYPSIYGNIIVYRSYTLAGESSINACILEDEE